MGESADLLSTPPLSSIDFDQDGVLTAVDVASWLYDCFFLPGDWALWAVAAYAPPVAAFFGVGPEYHGTGSAVISMLTWTACFVAVLITYRAVRDADQRLTLAIARAYADALRRLRIRLTLLKARLHRRAVPRREAIEVEAVELSRAEERVLALHASLRAGYALTVSDAARALSLRLHAAAALLEQLKKRGLVVRAVGGGEGEDAYALTTVGRAYAQQVASHARAGKTGTGKTGAGLPVRPRA